MRYTKEQLIKAQRLYNIDYLKDISTSEPIEPIDNTLKCATKQIEYLLYKVE